MTVFLSVLYKLIFLYVMILLGFVAGRYLGVKREPIATLLIYVIAPVVIFNGVMQIELRLDQLLLPVLFFVIASLVCLVSYKAAGLVSNGPARSIIAFSAGSGNTGYFGFPVVVAVLGEGSLGIAVLAAFGFILFENTLGFYITAKGNFSARDSLKRVLRLPTVYAFLLAVFLNLGGVRLNGALADSGASFRGAYSVLGMMMIGLGVASMTRFRLDLRMLAATFTAKFLVWPAIVLVLVTLDASFLGLFDEGVRKVMLLMSVVPLPANAVAVATELRAEPEKASVAVLASTAFALFFIPAVSALFL